MTLLLLAAAFASLAVAVRRMRLRADAESRAAGELTEVIEFTLAGITAGLGPDEALVRATHATGGTAGTAHFADAWNRGASTSEALRHLVTRCGSAAQTFCDSLSASLADGQSIQQVLTRLDAEARKAREREVEISVAKLPIRLAAPLVTCVLPAYILIGAIPVVAFAHEAFQ